MPLRNIGRDLRLVLRQLRKTPGFTITAILTLAFGIGATTAIFSIVEGVLLRPLPFAHPDRLVLLGDLPEGMKVQGETPGSTAPAILIYARDTRVFESMGGYQQTGFELSGPTEPAQINASRMQAGAFQTLGVSPLLGRTFTKEEDEARAQVVVLSYATWINRFHGDPHIIGTTVLLDRKTYEVIGVMPRDFEFPLVPGQLNQSELWVPVSFTQTELVEGAGSWNFGIVGRLKPGVTLEQARQDMLPAAQDVMAHFPASMGLSSLHIEPIVKSLSEVTVAEARPLVRMLFFAVIVVLFIACSNLAGLLLVRVIRRRREISVRLALGANSAAILRQSMVEACLLSLGGGVLGLGLASAALRAGLSFLPETLPRVSAIGLDGRVVAFALLLAGLTGLFCGTIPALTAIRTSVNEALKEGGRTGTEGSGHARVRSVLVITELAVALVLLTASGLLLRSFEKMREVNLGFRSDHTLTAFYGLPNKQYSTQASVDTFNSALLMKLRQLPGVQSVGLTSSLPEGSNFNNTGFVPEGYVQPKEVKINLSWTSQVSGDYFQAEGIPLLRGRAFAESDTATSPLVVIVNRTLAQHYWPGQDPIGKRVKIGIAVSPTPWATVVGEIADIKETSPDAETESQLYFPVSQFKAVLGQFAPTDLRSGSYGTIVLRSQQPPEQMIESLRSAVHSIDPQLALTNVESMDQ